MFTTNQFVRPDVVPQTYAVLNRGRKRAPNLRAADRIIAGLCTLVMRPARVLRSAIVLKAATLLHLQSMLRKRKYRLLFSPEHRHRPGPKGPKKDLIDAVVAMKRHNPGWGCPRIAQQIALASASRSITMLFAAS
jgi:putative transposase